MPNKKKSKKLNEVDNLKSQLARALADYDNLSKRINKEKKEMASFSSMTLIVKLLPIYDMLIRAQKSLKDSGIAITIKEFENLLNEERLERIMADKGTKFDENFHETVEVSKGPKKGIIEEELITGWKYVDGPVIRHSKVKVSE